MRSPVRYAFSLVRYAFSLYGINSLLSGPAPGFARAHNLTKILGFPPWQMR